MSRNCRHIPVTVQPRVAAMGPLRLLLASGALLAVIGAAAWWTDSLWLWGYLMGALMHLALDLVFNGEYVPRSISAFYSFGYRMAHGFSMSRLLGEGETLIVPKSFWGAFFRGASPSPAAAPELARPRVQEA